MAKGELVFLFPPSAPRISARDEIMSGRDECPERYLFYGLDFFQKNGIPFVHNLRCLPYNKFERLIQWMHRTVFGKLFRFYGEIEWVFPVWRDLYKSPLWFVFSERIMLALIYWQICFLLPRRPTVFIPMGLPEKLKIMQQYRPWLHRLVIRSLKGIECIVCVSKVEEQLLNNEFGIQGNTVFMAAGVDSKYFRPLVVDEDVDVLSIGADVHRDFELLLNSARMHKNVSFRIITTKNTADSFRNVPQNVEILTDVNMRQIRRHIARGRVLALPVVPNSYSGATTVLLQAMAMGKAVIANREGANAEGYPFQHKKNLLFVTSLKQEELNRAILTLLKDKALRKEIGANARETAVKELDLVKFHEKLFTVINDTYHQRWQRQL